MATEVMEAVNDSEPSQTSIMPLVNCVMCTTWPERSDMVHQAIASFLAQNYPSKTLTVVNDGDPCGFSPNFPSHSGAGGCSPPRTDQTQSEAALSPANSSGIPSLP